MKLYLIFGLVFFSNCWLLHADANTVVHHHGDDEVDNRATSCALYSTPKLYEGSIGLDQLSDIALHFLLGRANQLIIGKPISGSSNGGSSGIRIGRMLIANMDKAKRACHVQLSSLTPSGCLEQTGVLLETCFKLTDVKVIAEVETNYQGFKSGLYEISFDKANVSVKVELLTPQLKDVSNDILDRQDSLSLIKLIGLDVKYISNLQVKSNVRGNFGWFKNLFVQTMVKLFRQRIVRAVEKSVKEQVNQMLAGFKLHQLPVYL